MKCATCRGGERRDLAEAEARKARGRKRQEEKDYQFQSEESSHLLFLVGSFSFLLLWIRISNTDQLSGGLELAPLHFVL